MSSFPDAARYLLSLGHETLAIKLGLANIVCLLEHLGAPQQAYPAVQIAGTNGKGSTAAMLDSVCCAAGLRVGLYTSPHLVSLTERIRVDGQEIALSEFARLTERVRRAAFSLRDNDEAGVLPTFFEQVTAIALLAFRDAQVDLAILETGLGGRLDATTAALAHTIALTPIDFDHQEYLGHTLAEIAAEKAAIIRPGASVVIAAAQPPAACAVIEARCRECEVTPRFAGGEQARVIGADETGRLLVTIETAEDVYENVSLALRGRHQLTNAATAVALAEALRARGFDITRDAIREGLRTATHPGRLELQPGAPPLLFDGAHNPAGGRALRDYLEEFWHDAPITLVFGAMGDKDLSQIAATLFPVAAKIFLTRPDNARAATPNELRRFVPAGVSDERITLVASPGEAMRAAVAATPANGLLCVTGSLYLVGEVKSLVW